MSVANVLITSLEEVAADLLSGRTAQVYRIRQRRCYYLEHRCRTGRHRRQRSLHWPARQECLSQPPLRASLPRRWAFSLTAVIRSALYFEPSPMNHFVVWTLKFLSSKTEELTTAVIFLTVSEWLVASTTTTPPWQRSLYWHPSNFQHPYKPVFFAPPPKYRRRLPLFSRSSLWGEQPPFQRRHPKARKRSLNRPPNESMYP